MEKLQPIIKQKFWIILSIGLILTIVGWWMATSALAKTIGERRKAIEEAHKGIPTGENPNQSWTDALAKINDVQKSKVELAARELWERQKRRMVWPPVVSQFADKLEYRAEFSLDAAELYRTSYLIDTERVWKLALPLNPYDGTGLVDFPPERMPQRDWTVRVPTSEEMWDFQEDLWLYEPILRAITQVNGGAEANRATAVIHVINQIRLMGGDRNNMPSSGGGTGGMDAAAMGGMDGGVDPSMMMSAGMTGGAMPGVGGGSQSQPTSADFNPQEEFGNPGGSSPTMGGGPASFAADAESMMAAGDPSAAAEPPRRYVDDGDDLPYKTRAFYLSLVMDHRQVPNLVAALTANGESDWPMEVVRVQVVRMNSDGVQGAGSGASGFAGGPGGFPGGPGAFPGGPGAAFAGADMEEMMEDGGKPGGLSLGASSFPGAGGNFPGPGGGFPGAMAGLDGGSGIRFPMPKEGEYIDPSVIAAAKQSLATAMQDPFMARVALCGLIYMYKPVAPPAAEEGTPESPAPAAPATEAPPTDAAVAGEMPAEAAPAATAPAAAAPVEVDEFGNPVTPTEPAAASANTPVDPNDPAAGTEPSTPADAPADTPSSEPPVSDPANPPTTPSDPAEAPGDPNSPAPAAEPAANSEPLPPTQP
jgi:hypothetical protein